MTAVIFECMEVMIFTAMRPDFGTLNGADVRENVESHKS